MIPPRFLSLPFSLPVESFFPHPLLPSYNDSSPFSALNPSMVFFHLLVLKMGRSFHHSRRSYQFAISSVVFPSTLFSIRNWCLLWFLLSFNPLWESELLAYFCTFSLFVKQKSFPFLSSPLISASLFSVPSFLLCLSIDRSRLILLSSSYSGCCDILFALIQTPFIFLIHLILVLLCFSSSSFFLWYCFDDFLFVLPWEWLVLSDSILRRSTFPFPFFFSSFSFPIFVCIW